MEFRFIDMMIGTALLLAFFWLFFRGFKKMPLNAKSYNFTVSNKNIAIRGVFFLFSLSAVIAAYMNVDLLDFSDSESMKSSDIMFVIDVSKSMDIEDMKHDGKMYSRLEYSKDLIRSFINMNPQNNYGLIVFAGDTLMISPLTRDVDTYLTFLDGIDSSYISKGGTDFSKMLDVISDISSKKEENFILLSDGGDKDDSIMSNTELKKISTKIFTVGIGTYNGGKIPMGKDLSGKTVYKIFDGEFVTSALNEDNLKKIADDWNGKYINWADVDNIKKITDNLIIPGNSITKDNAENNKRNLIFVSFAIAIIGYLIPYRFKRGDEN